MEVSITSIWSTLKCQEQALIWVVLHQYRQNCGRYRPFNIFNIFIPFHLFSDFSYNHSRILIDVFHMPSRQLWFTSCCGMTVRDLQRLESFHFLLDFSNILMCANVADSTSSLKCLSCGCDWLIPEFISKIRERQTYTSWLVKLLPLQLFWTDWFVSCALNTQPGFLTASDQTGSRSNSTNKIIICCVLAHGHNIKPGSCFWSSLSC